MSEDPLIRSAAAQALGLIDPPSNDKTHYEALGRFLAAFANVEGILHVVARKLSGLSEEKARIVFASMRLSDVTDRIRNFIQLDRADKSKTTEETFADIEACLDQLRHIAIRRHNLVHRGATYFAGTFISSNSMIAKTLAGIESETILEKTLKDMHLDCGTIFLRLSYVVDATPRNDRWLNALRQRLWLYKPPPANNETPPPHEVSGSQKRQPRASRGSRTREAMKKHQTT
jgi:hypothetical protein